jgi:hypothetical protein
MAIDTIALPAIPRKIVRHDLMGGASATVKQRESEIEVIVPAGRRHGVDTIVKLELDGPAAGIPVAHQG